MVGIYVNSFSSNVTADIHDNTVDRQRITRGQFCLQRGEGRRDQRQRTVRRGDQRLTVGDRIGIAIERKHPPAGGEDRARVTARTEGRIDLRRAGLHRESFEHLVEQHGDVRRIAHSTIPFSPHWNSTASLRNGSIPSVSIITRGDQIVIHLKVPWKKATSSMRA